jgi:uncharacterized phiE125 gp8 family phage protein
MFEQLLIPRMNPAVTPEELASFARFDLPAQYDTSSPPLVTADYQMILEYINAATDFVEELTARATTSQTWLLTLDFFPGQQDPRSLMNYQMGYAYDWTPFWWYGSFPKDSIELIRRPVNPVSTTSPPIPLVVTYTDDNGIVQTMDSTTYTVFADKITLNVGEQWTNLISRRQDCIQIAYPCGYGDTADKVPSRLKMAIRFLAGWWYENRMPVATEPTTEVMFTINSLLGPFKMMRIPR